MEDRWLPDGQRNTPLCALGHGAGGRRQPRSRVTAKPTRSSRPMTRWQALAFKGWDFGNLPLSERDRTSRYVCRFLHPFCALLRGLTLESQLGVNPYAFGMIGSTDSHTTLATGDEDNFWGKHTGNEQSYEDRAQSSLRTLARARGALAGTISPVATPPHGHAAIRGRRSLMRSARREVYATTGPRMTRACLRRVRLHCR